MCEGGELFYLVDDKGILNKLGFFKENKARQIFR